MDASSQRREFDPASDVGNPPNREPPPNPPTSDACAPGNRGAPEPWIDCLAATLVIVACLAVECWTIPVFLRARAIQAWPTTEAVVVESTVRPRGDGFHLATVRYQYTVDGQSLESTLVSKRGTSSKQRANVEAIVRRYPEGWRGPVFYNPAAPAEAYLEAGPDWTYYLILLVPPIIAGWIGWRARPKFRAWLRSERQSKPAA